MNAFGISLAKEIQQIIATLEMIREMGWITGTDPVPSEY